MRPAVPPVVRRPGAGPNFFVLFFVVLAVAVVFAATKFFVLVRIQEGTVGIFYVGGSLWPELAMPGVHYYFALITAFHAVSTNFQTSTIDGVECGSKSGVIITFPRVEVVYRVRQDNVLGIIHEYGPGYKSMWIDRQLEHEVNEMCSQYSLHQIFIDRFADLDEELMGTMAKVHAKLVPGLEVIAIRMTKPEIPAKLAAGFQNIEEERSKLRLVSEKQSVTIKNVETEKRKKIIEAEQASVVAKIELKQRYVEALSRFNSSHIEIESMIARQLKQADAVYYSKIRLASSNEDKLSYRYLQLLQQTVEFQNTEMYIGAKVPDMIVELELTYQQQEYSLDLIAPTLPPSSSSNNKISLISVLADLPTLDSVYKPVYGTARPYSNQPYSPNAETSGSKRLAPKKEGIEDLVLSIWNVVKSIILFILRVIML